MSETLIVNLFGSPGSGKTTTMAGLFNKLKTNGINAEMVTEFAKELVWEGRDGTMKDELYIFAKQNHRLFRVNGKVDVVVTDRPLPLTSCYNHLYGDDSKELDTLCIFTFNKYNNLNIFLNRTKPYVPVGRVQTEEESDEIANIIKKYVLERNNISYQEFDSDEEVVDKLYDVVMKILKN